MCASIHLDWQPRLFGSAAVRRGGWGARFEHAEPQDQTDGIHNSASCAEVYFGLFSSRTLDRCGHYCASPGRGGRIASPHLAYSDILATVIVGPLASALTWTRPCLGPLVASTPPSGTRGVMLTGCPRAWWMTGVRGVMRGVTSPWLASDHVAAAELPAAAMRGVSTAVVIFSIAASSKERSTGTLSPDWVSSSTIAWKPLDSA
eukprot:5692410-Prymnesium_polylepis.1